MDTRVLFLQSVRLQVTLTRPVLISVFQACYQLACEVLLIQQVLLSSLLRCGLRSWWLDSPEEFHTEKIYIWNCTVKIGFYSICSLHPACEVSTMFLVAESTYKWPVKKYTVS